MQALRLLFEDKIDPNFPDPARDNALPIHTAAGADNRQMFDQLLQMGEQASALGLCIYLLRWMVFF
jgi:hypothetical protein